MTAAAAYRPEIDGLRAVAVLAVALYHGGIAPFSGGFVGVDVFFVISGYLITRIVAGEIAEGRFSLWTFYERRLRRIAPALIAVVLVVAAFTLLYKSPREANLFGESVTFVMLMISNVFFFNETGYFGEAAERFALLHTWSLSVEEQFYLVFPPLLMLLAARAPRAIGPVALGLAALSFAACLVMVEIERSAAFFLTPFRVWELMIGAALALKLAPAVPSRAAAEALAALGLGAIAFAVFAFDHATTFPGAPALLPTLGTAAILLAESRDAGGARTLVGRALALRPVVFVGLCSYSFYLWHWPALSFASYVRLRPLEATEAAAALAVAFLLSVASLYLIERPFRVRSAAGPRITTRSVVAGAGAAFAGVMALGLALQASKGWPERFPGLAPLFAEDVNRYGLTLGADCADAAATIPPSAGAAVGQTFCRFGDPAARPDFVVWGDSHALAAWPAFAAAAGAAGRAGYLSVYAVCPPLAAMDREIGDKAAQCRAQNAAVLAAIDALSLRQAILVGSWLGYGAGPENRAWLQARAAETVARLAAGGAEAAILAPWPIYPADIPSSVFRLRRLGLAPPFDVSRAGHEAAAAPIRAALAASGAPVLPSADALCDAERCLIEANGLPLYADTNHLNVHGAARLGPMAARLLAAPSFAAAAR